MVPQSIKIFLNCKDCLINIHQGVQSFSRVWLYAPHALQHARLPCPSPTPGACSNSCPSSWWCHPAIPSSDISFSSCLQSFPASGSFPMSQLFSSGSQSIGVSASTSILPMNIQDWFPLGWTGLNCYQHNNPISHRLYDCRARVNAAILSTSLFESPFAHG